jgi:hypothetical protein
MKPSRRFLQNLILGLTLALTAGFANAGALTDYAENKLIDWQFRGQAVTPPATWYVALYTTCPTDSTAGVEINTGSYARVAVTSSLANWAGTQAAGSTTVSTGTSGTTSNNNAVTFPAATADQGTAACFGLLDASTGGNLWYYAALSANRTITNGSTASFAAGTLNVQQDN